ncbi:MAG: A/G-specific adenine glycosylase [Mariprofundaceae bacterium]|nr:A/G-specific adenine glycosylase [Mariprofundaceae bacterium]
MPHSVHYKERQQQLHLWYEQQARDLPWRRDLSPYAVWISEVMLQQTQVKTVVPKFNAWLKRFPDLTTLALAKEDDVLKAWEGLGYYRRARFIHASAQLICEKHAAIFPEGFDDILALSGVGRSTAGAISSICFGAKNPVLDGNVKRVLRRWYGEREALDTTLWQWATEEIQAQSKDAGQWNQAMMELGATLCLARSTACARCPVVQHCASAHENQPAIKTKKAAVKNVYWQALLHQDDEKGIWMIQRPEKGIWAKLWCLPMIEMMPTLSEADHVHVLTHRRLHLHLKSMASLPQGQGKWVSDLDDIAIPTGVQRLLKKCSL